MKDILKKIQNIKERELSIYDKIEIGDPDLWLTGEELEEYLNQTLIGLHLDFPPRTRSKVIKNRICEVLGYSVPKSFKKVQPRFSGLAFDTYVQKADNLQVWNEELSVERRYILIRVDENNEVVRVKVVTGADLAVLDTTGTLTQKYQAKLKVKTEENILVNKIDTANIAHLCLLDEEDYQFSSSPIDEPTPENLIPIASLFKKLQKVVGIKFPNPGKDQDRLRGAGLHTIICKALSYKTYKDNGKFPDIKHQLLEIKLQTASTIDLGLVTPDSTARLDINEIDDTVFRHCDVRYAIFYGEIVENDVLITNFVLSSGENFFEAFNKFQGKGLNKKIQIPLPKDFFIN